MSVFRTASPSPVEWMRLTVRRDILSLHLNFFFSKQFLSLIPPGPSSLPSPSSSLLLRSAAASTDGGGGSPRRSAPPCSPLLSLRPLLHRLASPRPRLLLPPPLGSHLFLALRSPPLLPSSGVSPRPSATPAPFGTGSPSLALGSFCPLAPVFPWPPGLLPCSLIGHIASAPWPLAPSAPLLGLGCSSPPQHWLPFILIVPERPALFGFIALFGTELNKGPLFGPVWPIGPNRGPLFGPNGPNREWAEQ